eukprot:CAMPEP_0179017284 /NCGR_PEP_ID=MMETSP0796-20121207/3759_1 /TAXON_ID=73915 /ORGANISM="Pyrodinium bahamense, Strain pbaha01" /LENGTH=174 /DNA_ID=CAMNT_0020713007 /DNA_START=700 /DNA_END=1225 /DNA_ORIENTATION=+
MAHKRKTMSAPNTNANRCYELHGLQAHLVVVDAELHLCPQGHALDAAAPLGPLCHQVRSPAGAMCLWAERWALSPAGTSSMTSTVKCGSGWPSEPKACATRTHCGMAWKSRSEAFSTVGQLRELSFEYRSVALYPPPASGRCAPHVVLGSPSSASLANVATVPTSSAAKFGVSR